MCWSIHLITLAWQNCLEYSKPNTYHCCLLSSYAHKNRGVDCRTWKKLKTTCTSTTKITFLHEILCCKGVTGYCIYFLGLEKLNSQVNSKSTTPISPCFWALSGKNTKPVHDKNELITVLVKNKKIYIYCKYASAFNLHFYSLSKSFSSQRKPLKQKHKCLFCFNMARWGVKIPWNR